MSHPMPNWDFTNASEVIDDTGQSFRNPGDVAALPGCGVMEPNSWSETSTSLYLGALEGDIFPDIYGVFSQNQLYPTLPMQATTSNKVELLQELHEEESPSGGSKRKLAETDCQSPKRIEGVSKQSKRKQDDQTKRTRNMSERRRRERINEKLRALQELIPNCNKSDTASVLDDTIEYIEALKLRVQVMMSMGGGYGFHSPYMSQPGLQSLQVPNFQSFLSMRPGMGMGFGMGMDSMCYSTGIPIESVPSASLHPLPSAAAGLPLMSGSGVFPVPQLQMPFFSSQPLPAIADTSTIPPMVSTEVSSTFNYSNQGEYSSQNIPRIDHHKF